MKRGANAGGTILLLKPKSHFNLLSIPNVVSLSVYWLTHKPCVIRQKVANPTEISVFDSGLRTSAD